MNRSTEMKYGDIVLPFLLLALPLAAGGFTTPGWSWGWNHLHRLGSVWTAMWFLGAIAAWIPAIRRGSESLSGSIGKQLERRPRLWPVVAAGIGLVAFAMLPIATRIYGDGRYYIDDYSPAYLAVNLKRMLTFSLQARAASTFVLHDLVSRILGISFEKAYVVVSTLCGGLFVLAYARLAATIRVRRPGVRTLILLLGLADGANQLFFGHVENYTVVRLFECLFLMEIVRHLLDPERRVRWGRTALLFAAAVFFHSQALVLLPSLLLVIAGAAARRGLIPASWTRRRLAAWGTIAGVAIFIVLYFALDCLCYDYIYSGGRPNPRQVFLPITTVCVGLPFLRYTLFCGSHFLDLFGSLYSVSSPAILLILLAFTRFSWRDDGWFVFAPSIFFAFLHDFALNPAIGFPFDWDLMCVVSPPLLFAAVYLLAQADRPAFQVIPAVLPLAFAGFALFAINANEGRVRQRVEDMGVWLHGTYYGGTHYRLSANASTIRDPARQQAERLRVLERLTPRAYPDDREVAFLWERLALMRIEGGDFPGALEAYRQALATQPSRWDRMKPVGYLESEVGSAQRGARLLMDYTARAMDDAEGFLLLGDALVKLGDAGGARRAWRRFLQLAPGAPESARVREDLRDLPPESGMPGG